ncbi:MAG: NAD-binding protein [Cyanobacteriota bacterium]
MQAFGQGALVVDPQPLPAQTHRWHQLQGDPRQREVLQRAGIKPAKVVVLLQDNNPANFELALLIRDLNPQVRIISRLFNRSIAAYLDLVLPQHFSLQHFSFFIDCCSSCCPKGGIR